MQKPRRPRRANDPARLPVVSDAFEAVTEADRRFFRRWPNRAYRLRHTAVAEIEQAERAGAPLDDPLPGFRWFTAIRQIRKGVRLRAYVQAPELCDTDVPEALARKVYHEAEGQDTREMTARLVAGLKQAGAL